MESDYRRAESDYRRAESDYRCAESDYRSAESDYRSAESDYRSAESDSKSRKSDSRDTERMELLDIMFTVAENSMFWFLIVLTTIRLILSWLIGNFTNCVLMVCQVMITVTRELPWAFNVFQVWFWEIQLVLSRLPGLCVVTFIRFYQQFGHAVVSCLKICQSVPLQKDDLCDQVSRGGTTCITWIRQHCLSRNICHLWVKVSRAICYVCRVCIVGFQSHCLTISDYLTRYGTMVLNSSVISCLGYAFSNIFQFFMPYIRHIWMFIAWVFLAVTGSLLRQLDKLKVLFKQFCYLTVSKSDGTSTWVMTCQDLRRFMSRLLCSGSMTCWRMLHFRCSPRSGFYAILVFVVFTFVLTTYLYSGSFIDTIESTRPIENQLQQRNNNDLRSRHINDFSPHKQADRLVKSVYRHKNQHWNKEQPAEETWQHSITPGLKQVQDVINLMSRLRSPNESSTMGIQKQLLRRQIQLLREAMVSKNGMLPKPQMPPTCVGNLVPGEVEDILCIPRPKFLSHIKNPCWYSEVATSDGEKILHCLPYFHILGCAKSGTTDLWNRLMSHPHTVSNDGLLHKEALWWSWYRYGISGYSRRRQVQNFSDYVSLFQDTARQIQSSIDKETLLHQILITGDASPPDFWDFRGWVNISQNRQQDIPRVITPHLMRHFYANPKFIIMFRDPIDRLYSDYFFVGLGLTADDFHNDILASVDLLAQCVEQFGLQHCFYDHDLYVKLPVRLPFACYSVFMREWLQVFPLENFLFIKTEDYKKNSEDTLKSVMDFLGLGPLKDTQLQVIAEEENSRITVQRQIAGPMKNATKILLKELLGDCSIELRKLIKSDKFTWD